MNSNGARVALTDPQKFVYNLITGRASIYEVEVGVLDPVLQEAVAVVLNVVQTDHVRNPEVLEDLNVVFGAVAAPVVLGVHRAHERDELARDRPVQVAVLHLLVVLVLLRIECSKVVPPVHHRQLQALEAVEHRAVVVALPVGGVPEGFYFLVVRLEGVPRVLGAHFQNHHHEGAH